MSDPPTGQDLVDVLHGQLDGYVEDLHALTAIDCPSMYKPGLDAVADWVSARLVALGAQTRVIANQDTGDDIVGIFRGTGGARILLLCHMDTVYPVGTAGLRPLRVEGRKILAPGAADMKAGILTALYACSALSQLGWRAFEQVTVLCTSDEEAAPRHSVETIKTHAADSDCVFCMEPARANGDVVSARKGSVVYDIVAHGKESHAGVNPGDGRNAIVALANLLTQAWALTGQLPGLTVSPGVIAGGTATNVVPALARCSIDVRVTSAPHVDAVLEMIRDFSRHPLIPDVTFEVSHLPPMPPMEKTAASQHLVELAQRAAAEIGFAVNDTFTGGGSDGAHAASTGTPVLDGLGPIGGHAHSEDEYVEIDSIVPRTAMLARMITLLS
jgi:glutamate carboxypeptidase